MLNHLKYVINFSKKFKIVPQKGDPSFEIEVEDEEKDPFHDLTSEQRQTAYNYLLLATNFAFKYRDLFGKVISSSLLPQGGAIDVNLLKKGLPGEKHTYLVKFSPVYLSSGETDELDKFISDGAIPIIGKEHIDDIKISTLNAKSLASLLAMKSVELVLPQFKPADGKTILEARERLEDYLPPFWSSMLKLSTDLKAKIEEGTSVDQLYKECQDIIDTTVRPTLIDLNQKLLSERKKWFAKIINPVAKGAKILVGIPPVSRADLVSAGLAIGAGASLDVANQIRKSTMFLQSGLTFLIELEKFLKKK